MKGIQITQYVKSLDNLQVTSIPIPVPKPDEYLVRIYATATNFFDILQVQGKYQHQPPFPWTAGSEFAGTIVQVPALARGGDSRFKVGDRVFGATQGGYAEYICVKELNLLPVPEGWGFEDAAGLYVTAPTSYAALVTRAELKRGEWVLVHAAAGGVSLAAIQIAKAMDCIVIATASSDRKLDIARRYGADFAVNYYDGPESWVAEIGAILKKHGRRGVDVVFDPVGLINHSLKVAAWNARLIVVGFAGGNIEKVTTNRVLLKNVSIVGVHWGMYATYEPEMVGRVWEDLFELIRLGKFKSTVYRDRVFMGLDSVKDALKALGSRETWGKVVIRLPVEGGSKL